MLPCELPAASSLQVTAMTCIQGEWDCTVPSVDIDTVRGNVSRLQLGSEAELCPKDKKRTTKLPLSYLM